MTDDVYAVIKEELSDPGDLPPDVATIIGIPIERFPNERAMIRRVFELRDSGKRVAVLLTEERARG